MALFLFIAAVRDKDPIEIAASIKLYLDSVGIESKIKNAGKWREEIARRDNFQVVDPPAITAIFSPINNFSVISFDNCPFEENKVCKHLSHQLNTLVSLIEVYDSNTWYHRLFQQGEIIDQFSNNPYDLEVSRNTNNFNGNANLLSEIFGIRKSEIEPYLFQFSSENRDEDRSRKIKPSDLHALGDEWFFTDFWKVLGIKYPKKNPHLILLHEIR